MRGDILHNILLGILKYLMEWIEGFLKKHKRCCEAESCLVIRRYHIRQSTIAVRWRHLLARMWIYYYSFVK